MEVHVVPAHVKHKPHLGSKSMHQRPLVSDNGEANLPLLRIDHACLPRVDDR